MDGYRCLHQGGVGEIEEKKSRFIATVRPVMTEEEAVAFVNEIKKDYWDATHNCSAFVIGRNAEVTRCSDDGEPGGTAGRPMLEVLLGEGIRNVAVVVTRYFGGTLLGTGGLVRAYQSAAKEGLKDCLVIDKKFGCRLLIKTDYTGVGKLQYLFGSRGYSILKSDYTETVAFEILLPKSSLEKAIIEIIEATSGQAAIEKGEECCYADVNGSLLLFEE